MELYIGGYKQGKLKYVLTKYPDAENRVYNDLHLWIREMLQENQDAANDKCNTAERVPPWHNIDLPTKSNGLCGKQADAR